MDANLIRFRQLSGFQTIRNPLRRNFSALGSIGKNGFNEAAFETERLRLDSKAREEMAEKSQIDISSSNAAKEGEEDPKAWKWIIRKRVWDMTEAENISQNPRPVHHRIPNFVGAAAAAEKKVIRIGIGVFKTSDCVKVNPDSPQKQVRFGIGVAKYGMPIGLDEKLKVDLIVIGSVSVDPKTGALLGKGERRSQVSKGQIGSAADSSFYSFVILYEPYLVDLISYKFHFTRNILGQTFSEYIGTNLLPSEKLPARR
ncbi:hypothetical protein MKW92_025766 [Papaver armeniacum]|nr:hypothetical protein MKW92_025766 [Papaver armeniacum]